MKSILKMLLVLVLLSGWVLAALEMHFVWKPDGQFGALPKNRIGIGDTFIDLRSWTPDDVAAHPDFVRRVIAAGKSNWLMPVLGTNEKQTPARLAELLAGGELK